MWFQEIRAVDGQWQVEGKPLQGRHIGPRVEATKATAYWSNYTCHLLSFPPHVVTFPGEQSSPVLPSSQKQGTMQAHWIRHVLTLAFCFSACSWASISSGLVYCLTRPLWPPFLPAQRSEVQEGEREGCMLQTKGTSLTPTKYSVPLKKNKSSSL